ncbi:MAG: ACP S-malonyltransferase [Balneolaceae bacterium]
MSKAILFPGQGSQHVGMGVDRYASNKIFKRRLDQADEAVDFDLKERMFNGPADELTRTDVTQPAIFVHSVALYESEEIMADRVAGHSLGECSALVASGALTFEEGLELVVLRGQLMQKAANASEGTMAAIIGMDDEIVEAICDEATDQTFKPVVAANYNSPGQIVISGDLKAVEMAVELAKGRGCRLAKLLPVGGAFHSPLMEPAAREFGKKLETLTFRKPECPVYCNVTARPTRDPDELQENLFRQLTSPVRWTQTILQMEQDGAEQWVEVGPGKILQGLVKRTVKGAEYSGIE